MTKERIALWDNVKFLLMLVVVAGHFINHDLAGSHLYRSAFMFIWSFHMPLFIFISGLFHKNKNIKEKAISYFSIYIVLKICFFLLKAFTNQGLSFSVFTSDALPWFVFALAAFDIITYFLRDIDSKYILVISILLGLFSGYDKNINGFLVMSRIIVYYPFYLIGTMVNKERIENLAKKWYVKVISGAIILAWAGVCFFWTDKIYFIKPLLAGRRGFSASLMDYGILYRAGIYAVAVIIGLCFIFIVPTFKLGVITKFGQRTLQVYFWHNLIIWLLVYIGVFDYFADSGYLRIVWALFSIPLTFILSLDIFKFPVNYLMYNPKKNKQ